MMAAKAAPKTKLLIATSNPGKRAEFARLLPAGVELVTLDEVPVTLPPEEGTTFAENAVRKALVAATESGILAIADDSGLEVDALGGAPGVRSARFAGEPPSDARNREALSAAMRSIPPGRRQAHFSCVVALARPDQLLATAEGRCDGAIAHAPAGQHGFGYDPLFELPHGRTMAELEPEEKDRISHRGQAHRALMPSLLAALGEEREDEDQR